MMVYNQLSGGIKIPDNPVLYLDAHNQSSYPGYGAIWNDLSGNNYNGAMVGDMVYTPNNGGVMLFDGGNDYVSFADINALDGLNQITISFWMNKPILTYGSAGDGLITKWGSTGNKTFAMLANSTGLSFYIYSGSTAYILTIPHIPSANTWYNIIFMYNGTAMTCYINGVLQATTTSVSITMNSTTHPVKIGTYQNLNDFFKGNMNDVLIYNRALTTDEIYNLYNSTKHKYNISNKGPVLQLDANNVNSYIGTGTAWSDISGYGNNGTLNGGVAYSNSNGGVMSFDGVNDYVNSTSLNFTDTITVSVWKKRNSTIQGTAGSCIIGKWGSTNSFILYDRESIKRSQFVLYTNNGTFIVSDGTTESDTIWHHLVATYDGTNLKFYKDGILTENISATGTINQSSIPIELGRYGTSPTYNYFSGLINDSLIYNRALSQQEVSDLYNSQKNKYILDTNEPILKLDATNLNSYLPNSLTWKDISYNGNNGTLTNGVSYNGQSMVFDGANDYVNLGNKFNPLLSSQTISIWFKTSDVTSIKFLLSKGNISSVVIGYSIFIESGILNCRMNANGLSTQKADNRFNISANTWYNVVMVIDREANILRSYLNNILSTTTVFGTNITGFNSITNTKNFYLGATETPSNYFIGQLNDVLVYNRAITAQEVSDIYNNTKSKYGL